MERFGCSVVFIGLPCALNPGLLGVGLSGWRVDRVGPNGVEVLEVSLSFRV